MRSLSSSVIILVGAGILTACGGGGGGDDGSSVRAPLALNANNGQRVAVGVIESGEVLRGAFNSLVFTSTASAERTSLPKLTEFVHSLTVEQFAAGSAEITTAASRTINCPGGGTRTINEIDKNGNNQPDPGDSVSVTHNNCANNGAVANGIIRVEILTAQGIYGSTSSDWTFRFGIGFDNFSVTSGSQRIAVGGGFNLDTSYRVSNAVYRTITSGSELNFSNGRDTARLVNFRFDDRLASASSRQTWQYNAIYDVSELAGSVTVVTNVPFVGIANLPPESGRLTIHGANNTRVVAAATGGGTARISIDANGDGDFTDSEDQVINGQWTTFFG